MSQLANDVVQFSFALPTEPEPSSPTLSQASQLSSALDSDPPESSAFTPSWQMQHCSMCSSPSLSPTWISRRDGRTTLVSRQVIQSCSASTSTNFAMSSQLQLPPHLQLPSQLQSQSQSQSQSFAHGRVTTKSPFLKHSSSSSSLITPPSFPSTESKANTDFIYANASNQLYHHSQPTERIKPRTSTTRRLINTIRSPFFCLYKNSPIARSRSFPSLSLSLSVPTSQSQSPLSSPSLFSSPLTPSSPCCLSAIQHPCHKHQLKSTSSNPCLYQSTISQSACCSPNSVVFPLDPNFELELEIALQMAPSYLGSAWSAASYDASQYLKARTPYPPTITGAMFDYHQKHNRASTTQPARWDSSFDIGCGPGQIAIHLASRFKHVYGQDPSDKMLELANTVKKFDAQELASLQLPPVDDPSRIEFSQADGESPKLPAGAKVDMITLASCAHWLDWSTTQSSISIWTKWAELLLPGGSLVITGTKPIVGPLTGPKAERMQPLRQWLADFPTQYPHLDKYYDPSKFSLALGQTGLYQQFPMPWDHDEKLGRLWNRDSLVYLPIQDGRALKQDGTLDLPDWLAPSTRRAALCDDSHGDFVIHKSTPRKQAEWIRSTSIYVRLLEEDAEQRKLSLHDEDFAAVEIRKVCQQIGIGYDDEIECHLAGVVIGVRRSELEYLDDWSN